MLSENVSNPVLLLGLDHALYMYIERQGFGSVNPEICDRGPDNQGCTVLSCIQKNKVS